MPLESETTRPGPVKAAALVQCVLAVCFSGFGIIFLLPCRSTNELEAFGCAALMDFPPALAIVLIAIGLIAVGGAVGMWKGRVWSWWLSLFVDLITSGGSIYQTIKDRYHMIKYYGSWNFEEIAFGLLVATVPIGLLMLPSVRQFCLRKQVQPTPPEK